MSDNYDFSIYWKKNGNQITDTVSKRTYRSLNSDSFKNNWVFNSSQESIYLLEHFRQEFEAGEDLSQYTLGIRFNNIEGLPSSESWLAVGDHEMKGTFPNLKDKRFIEFNLCDLREGLVGTTSAEKATQGVRQFTFIPYTEPSSTKGNNQYFGKRIVSITTGPSTYSDVIPKLKTGTKSTSEIKTFAALKDKQDTQILPDFTVTIGGIADLLLNKGYENAGGLPEDVSQYNLIVDDLVDTNEKLLAQSILVTYSGSNPNYTKKFGTNKTPVRILLENNIPWFVTGSVNGIVDSRTKSLQGYAGSTDNKFYNTALELQSSFKGTNPTSNTPSNRAISVVGITFKDNAKNNRSAIQLNGFNDSGGSYDWWVPTDEKNQPEIYWRRIKTAIDNFVAGKPANQYFNQSGNGNSPVYMYDNQISAWVDGSDGPETLAPHSLFERNFQLIADDNIKVLSNNSKWNDMTLIQGNTGSAISLGSYGYTNGNVSNNGLSNISIPRIAQYNPFDYINGVISNKSVFGKTLQGPKYHGIDNNSIGSTSDKEKTPGTGVYINSWNKGTSKTSQNINAIRDIGILSALNQNSKFNLVSDFSNKNLLTSNNTRYALGNNHFSYSIDTDIFYNNIPKVLMYAFGTNASSANVKYSGANWNTMTEWDTGLNATSDNTLTLEGNIQVFVNRVDQKSGVATIGLENGAESNVLLSSVTARSNHIAALNSQNINSDQGSVNWLSTEGLRVGPLSSSKFASGTYRPYAIYEGKRLAIKDLQNNGNSIDVLFEKDIQARFFTPSTGSWLNSTSQSEKIYLNIKRLGRLKTSLGFYECDPVTGAILIDQAKIKPADDQYLQHAIDLSKSSNLFFTDKDMPSYGSEIVISDITDFKPNASYGLLLSVDDPKNSVYSSFSVANPSKTMQMISAASKAGEITFSFEDVSIDTNDSDQDFNDLIVTIGAQTSIPNVQHSTSPTGFVVDYSSGGTYQNLIDLDQNTVFADLRAN